MTVYHWKPTKQIGTSWVPNAIPHEVQVILWTSVLQMILVGLSIVYTICRKTKLFFAKFKNVRTRGRHPDWITGLDCRIADTEKVSATKEIAKVVQK